MRKFFSNLLILIGLAIVIISALSLWFRNNPNRLAFSVDNMQSVQLSHSQMVTPTVIYIKNISVQLPIVSAELSGKKWETTSEGVSYLASTPIPGELGNSVLYGHNWGSILGNLNKLSPGDKIEILFSDGEKREFEVKYKQEVSPTDTSILGQTTDSRITLYTCSGLLDQKRLVVTARLIS